MKGCFTFIMISLSFIIISSLLFSKMNCLSITFRACNYYVTKCRAFFKNIPKKTLEKPPRPIICSI